MTDPRQEIDRLIALAEQRAYEKGWRDALAAVADAAEGLRAGKPAKATEKPTVRRGRPPSAAMMVVEQCIKAAPGMTGVQIVESAQLVNGKIVERTVRTCLRRLRIAEKIRKQGERWYPSEQLPLAA